MKYQNIIKHLTIIFAVISFWGSIAFFFSEKYPIAIIFFILFIILRIEYEKMIKNEEREQSENEHE